MSWFDRLKFWKSPEVDRLDLDSLADLEAQLPAPVLKAIKIGDLVGVFAKGKPQWTKWAFDTAVNDGFKKSVWVFAGIYRIAKAVASVPWRVEQGSEFEGWKPLEAESELYRLIERPNPFWSHQDYMERLVMHCYLGGECFQYKNRVDKRNTNRPAELWIINPDKIAPVPSKGDKGFIDGYMMKTAMGKEEPVKTADIIHQVFTSPNDLFRGFAPVEAAGRAVDLDVESGDWQKNAVENQAIASGILSYDHNLTQKQFDAATERIREQQAGPDNARKPWVLGNKVQWHQISLSPVDMDLINGRKMQREEILAALGVPPPMVGILEDATLANMEVSRTVFWLDTIIPLLDDIMATWNRALTPDFGEGIRLAYDTSKVRALLPVFRQNVDTAERLWRMGCPFELLNRRLELGIDRFVGDDVSYVQGRFEPRGTSGESLSADPEPEGVPDNGQMAKFVRRLDDRIVDLEERLGRNSDP